MSRFVRVCAAFAALVSLGAGCSDDDTGLTAGDERSEPTTTTADPEGSSPDQVPVDDDRWEPYVLAPGGLTGTRTSPDGRSLLVTFVGGPPYVAGEPCTVAYRVEASEAADEVAIRLYSNAPPAPDGELFCTAAGHFRSVEVGLQEPLGGRTVVEEESQRVLHVFDGSSLAEPTWMPDGWSLLGEQAGYPAPETASYWQRTWGPEPLPPTGNACAPTDGPITLTEGPASGPGQDVSHLRPVSTHDVNGAVATYYDDGTPAPNTVALVWESEGQSLLLSSSPACFDEGTASLDRLLQFARALRLPAR